MGETRVVYDNMLLALFEQYRASHGYTYAFWADRWTGLKKADWKRKGKDMTKFRPIHPATVARWAKCDRRIGPNNRYIFDDPLVPFTMDEYYRDTPPSDQTKTRSHVRFLGRTRAKSKLAAELSRINQKKQQIQPEVSVK